MASSPVLYIAVEEMEDVGKALRGLTAGGGRRLPTHYASGERWEGDSEEPALKVRGAECRPPAMWSSLTQECARKTVGWAGVSLG